MRSFSTLNLPGFMVLSLLGSQIHCVWNKIIGVCNDKKCYLIKTDNFSQVWLEKGTLKITYNELDGNTSIIPFKEISFYICYLPNVGDLPSQVWPDARYPSLQTQSSRDVLPGGEVWFSSGHGRQVLIPPGEPSGLYVPDGQAAEVHFTWIDDTWIDS